MNQIIPATPQAKSAADLYAFDITANCTLVKLSISQYSGRKKDEDLARDAARQNRGSSDAYEAFLKMLPDETRKAIQQIATEARDLYKFHTTPWDTGWALVNNKSYEKLMNELEAIKLKFDAAVGKEVLDKRDELADLSDTRLGKRANLFPFPTVEQLKAEYSFSVETMPIANPKDMRLQHVSPETARRIEAQTTQLLNDKLKGSMTIVVSRLRSVVERVFTTLSDEDKIFRDSMIENVKDLCSAIPDLNITGDKFISNVADEIAATLGSIDCEKVRDEPEARKAAAASAEAILAKLDKVKVNDNLKVKPDTTPAKPTTRLTDAVKAKLAQNAKPQPKPAPAPTNNGGPKKTGVDRLKGLRITDRT